MPAARRSVPRRQRQPAGLLRLGSVRDYPHDRPGGSGGNGDRLRSADVDPDWLRSDSFKPRLGNADDHHLSFLSEYTITPAVASLAKSFVAGVPEGWSQVEAVIAAIRRGYAHDRAATIPPDCTDVVAEFLLRSHQGPDYLFASSAAVLLRSLGYPTRVVSGLYATPEMYDPRHAAHAGNRRRRSLLGRGSAAGRAFGSRSSPRRASS